MGDSSEDRSTLSLPPDKPADFSRVSPWLDTLIVTYDLTTHHAFGLLSREELAALPGFGPALNHELLSFCGWSGIELRGAETMVARAAALYGSIMSAPVVPVLGVIFRKPGKTKAASQAYKIDRTTFVEIRRAVMAAEVRTIGDLVVLLTTRPDIPKVPAEAPAVIRQWMEGNLFRW